jgi:hypothetical protein
MLAKSVIERILRSNACQAIYVIPLTFARLLVKPASPFSGRHRTDIFSWQDLSLSLAYRIAQYLSLLREL